MMNSISYGEFDDDNFEELLGYLVHVNKSHPLKMIMIHPTYYKNMLKEFGSIWYEIRLSSHADKGFDRLEYGELKLEVMVNSLMDGKWCVI